MSDNSEDDDKMTKVIDISQLQNLKKDSLNTDELSFNVDDEKDTKSNSVSHNSHSILFTLKSGSLNNHKESFGSAELIEEDLTKLSQSIKQNSPTTVYLHYNADPAKTNLLIKKLRALPHQITICILADSISEDAKKKHMATEYKADKYFSLNQSFPAL